MMWENWCRKGCKHWLRREKRLRTSRVLLLQRQLQMVPRWIILKNIPCSFIMNEQDLTINLNAGPMLLALVPEVMVRPCMIWRIFWSSKAQQSLSFNSSSNFVVKDMLAQYVKFYIWHSMSNSLAIEKAKKGLALYLMCDLNFDSHHDSTFFICPLINVLAYMVKTGFGTNTPFPMQLSCKIVMATTLSDLSIITSCRCIFRSRVQSQVTW